MRGVIDNNVLVSAAIHGGIPLQALRTLLVSGTLLTSIKVLRELAEVLDRDKFDKYLPAAERLDFISDLLKVIEFIKITAAINICRDPKDNMLLELAVSGDADYLITGDGDLLELNPFRGVEIITPRKFLGKSI